MTGIAAEVVLLVHFLFILFVVLGGLLVFRWAGVAWAHLPALAWGVTVEWTGWICPLTPLENRLRRAAGEEGYSGGFIDHYLWPLIYPEGLTREIQLLLGFSVLLVNAVVYGLFLHSRRGRARGSLSGQ